MFQLGSNPPGRLSRIGSAAHDPIIALVLLRPEDHVEGQREGPKLGVDLPPKLFRSRGASSSGMELVACFKLRSRG